ncbi:oxysterol-binding -related 11, partial [Brachionus plicatilis]
QEGNLYKYTNVVKGFQMRYFMVSAYTGKLNYYMSEDLKYQKPRGSIELLNSIISPSEEDSTTFTINTPDNEIFKLRAQDAKERQHWVNILRLVAHSKEENNIKIYVNEKPEEKESLKSKKSLVKKTSQELIKEIFYLINLSHKEFENSIDNLSQTEECRYDEDLLILKATTSSCVKNLINSCQIMSRNLQEEKDFVEDTEIGDSLTYSQRFDHGFRNLLDSSYGSSSNAAYAERTSPKKSLINPDDEITDEENEIVKNLINDQVKENLFKFFSNLAENLDLTRTQIPVQLLNKKSLLESYANLMSQVDLLIKIADEKKSEDRFVAVILWVLASLLLIKSEFVHSKPFNPVLGEVFNCSWKANGDHNSKHVVNFTAEKVSHHPLVCAIYMECKEKNVKVNANIMTKAVYSGTSITVPLMGEMIVKLESINEEYSITFPKVYARSIVTNPWVELGDSCSISCAQTGLKANIQFEVKSFYGDTLNQVFAELRNKNEEVFCKMKGEWDAKLEFIFGNEASRTVKSFDLRDFKPLNKRVRPIDLQEEYESRNLWKDVAEALQSDDYEQAHSSRSIIEKQQRLTDKLRKEKNLGYLSKNFFKTKFDKSSSSLCSKSSSESDHHELVHRWWHKNWSG